MATISGGACNHAHIDLIVSESKVSTSDNTSTVSWKLVGYLDTASSSYWYSNNYHTISVKINGATVYSLANTTAKSISIGTNHTQSSPLTIASGTAVVAHNSDGGKTCACSLSVVYRYSSSYSWSGSGSITLTHIARAASMSLSATKINTGSKLTITLTNANSKYTHTLKWMLPNGSTTGGVITTLAAGVKSYVWTIPASMAGYMSSSTSLTVKVIVQTLSGSTIIGSYAQNITVTLPDSVKPGTPTVSITAASGNSIVNGWGVLVAGYSKAVFKISATPGTGSSIASYIVSAEGKSYSGKSPLTTGVIKGTSVSYSVKAVDKRGRSTTKTGTMSLYSYSTPAIGSVNVYRCTSDKTASDSGTCILLKASLTYSSCGGKNTGKITYKIESNGSVVRSGTLTSGQDSLVSGLSATKSYKVTIIPADSVNTGNGFIKTIFSRKVAMCLRASAKGGAAFGKIAEYDECLDIGSWQFRCGSILPSDAGKFNIGTGAVPFANVRSNKMYICDNSIDYGSWQIFEKGTKTVDGQSRLVLGNGIKTGNADNAYGRIFMFGKGAGYTLLQPGNNSDENVNINLPSTGGTLALRSELSAYIPNTGGSVNGSMYHKNGTNIFFYDKDGATRTMVGLDSSNNYAIATGQVSSGDIIIGNNSSSLIIRLMRNVRAYHDIDFGYWSAATEYGLLTLWKDGSRHYAMSRLKDGLTLTLGWAGSASYKTVTRLRAQTVQYQNSSGTTTLSDERLKDEWKNLDAYEKFFDALEPCSFVLKNGTSHRRHLGFKAGQVLEALKAAGLTSQDFAGYVESAYHDDPDSPKDNALYASLGIKDGDMIRGLIYTEFISLITSMLQKTRTDVAELKKRMEELHEN